RGAAYATRGGAGGARGALRAEARGDSRGRASRSAYGDARDARAMRSQRLPFDAADQAWETQEAEEHVREAARPSSLRERVSAKVSAAKRSHAQCRAERRFSQQYGGADRGAGAEAAAGPRAAVYKGEMGTKHRRAARMQDDAAPRGGSARSASARKTRRLSPVLAVSAAVAACLLLGGVFLYTPAQQFYQEVRERDRLQAEYTVLQQRNDAIQGEVDALSSSAGVEDRARAEFGWVKKGETAGSVGGLDVEKDSSFRANIVPGSVEAPETWYSFLDPVFGVK
uniref:FtsB family cell division protein n=1 Tax=Adlercreutzia sp. ZJ473 TaxID=2722822 RepID=UPI0015557203